MVEPVEKITISSDSDSTEESKFIDNRRKNIKSDYIEITEDKLENILLKHLSKLEIRKAWSLPLSIFITVLLTLLTTNFTNAFNVSAAVWHAVFLLIGIGSFIWFIASIVKLVLRWRSCSIEALLNVIKNVENSHKGAV